MNAKPLIIGLAVGAVLIMLYQSSQPVESQGGEGEAAPEEEGGGILDAIDSAYYSIVGFDMENKNLRAFLGMIRTAEGTAGPNGYRTLFGGTLFSSFADHPRIKITARSGGSPITSSAAGAYQIIERTWNEVAAKLGLPDFSPASQDRAAVELIRRRGALRDVYAGRLDAAIVKCNREWASLPGSPYGQPTISADRAYQLYAAAGGEVASV